MINARAVPTDDYLVAFQRRILQDAFLEADKAYWLRRATMFDDARPRPGDFTGAATAADIEEQWTRMTMLGQACRIRAGMADDATTAFSDVWVSVAVAS